MKEKEKDRGSKMKRLQSQCWSHAAVNCECGCGLLWRARDILIRGPNTASLLNLGTIPMEDCNPRLRVPPPLHLWGASQVRLYTDE